MPVRLVDLADVHGAMLVHGKATPARHHLDDLLAQEGESSRLSAAAVAVTTTFDIETVTPVLILPHSNSIQHRNSNPC